MDIREFINLVAAGNTEYDQLEAIARELQSVMPTDPAPTRTLRVWTLACDDNRNSTYASVHLTERAAWENLVRLVTSEQDTVTREKATTFIEAKEYGELHAYLKNECFDLNDTYNVDYDDLELPGTEGPLATAKESSTGPVQVFDDRELATVLHALRCLQEFRQKLSGTPADPGCTFSERYGCLSKPSTACDHFEDVEPLTVEEIDALCERLNLTPQPPSPAQTVLNAQFDAAYIAAGRRKLSGCLDDEYDILDNATVSEGNGGAFVSARVWVSHEDAGRCNGCGTLADQLFEGKCRSCAGPPAY